MMVGLVIIRIVGNVFIEPTWSLRFFNSITALPRSSTMDTGSTIAAAKYKKELKLLVNEG